MGIRLRSILYEGFNTKKIYAKVCMFVEIASSWREAPLLAMTDQSIISKKRPNSRLSQSNVGGSGGWW